MAEFHKEFFFPHILYISNIFVIIIVFYRGLRERKLSINTLSINRTVFLGTAILHSSWNPPRVLWKESRSSEKMTWGFLLDIHTRERASSSPRRFVVEKKEERRNGPKKIRRTFCHELYISCPSGWEYLLLRPQYPLLLRSGLAPPSSLATLSCLERGDFFVMHV